MFSFDERHLWHPKNIVKKLMESGIVKNNKTFLPEFIIMIVSKPKIIINEKWQEKEK